ncbi:MAG: disulfide bond formation protein B [Haloarculaceae archaeon]
MSATGDERRWGRRATVAAWTVALVATAGSLFYQFGMGLYPCELCWFQRVLMYPLVVVLGYATVADQRDVHRVVLPLALPGAVLAAYHSYLQVAPGMTCSFAGCGRVQFRLLGLTVPNQSLLAFVLLVGLMAVVGWRFRTRTPRP